MLPPGIPALIFLAIATILSFICGIVLSPSSGGLNTTGINWFFFKSPIKFRSIVTATIAFPFWIWAIIYVVSTGSLDAGVISFLLVLISSCCVVRCSSSRPSSVLPSVLLIMSNVCVSVNYAIAFSMGVLDDFFWTKQLYFAVGIIYWASISLWNLRRSPVPSTPPSHPPWCWWVIVVVHNNMNTTTNNHVFPISRYFQSASFSKIVTLIKFMSQLIVPYDIQVIILFIRSNIFIYHFFSESTKNASSQFSDNNVVDLGYGVGSGRAITC